jgi:hypothetical protein
MGEKRYLELAGYILETVRTRPSEEVGPRVLPHLHEACTNFFPQYSPAIPIPVYRVILSHFAGHPHTEDFFQVLFAPQSSMGIPWISCSHRKTLLPLGKKARFQKLTRGLDQGDEFAGSLQETSSLRQTEPSPLVKTVMIKDATL